MSVCVLYVGYVSQCRLHVVSVRKGGFHSALHASLSLSQPQNLLKENLNELPGWLMSVQGGT